MAWTTPPTFVAGNALTAAQLNVISADLNETAPAKATTGGQLFVSTAANTISARSVASATVLTQETTTSTTYADLATPGPSVAVTTGTQAFVWIASHISQTTATANTAASFEVSNAGSGVYQPATDNWSVLWQPPATGGGMRAGSILLLPALVAGSNTFKMKYRASAGTGSFQWRTIMVLPL